MLHLGLLFFSVIPALCAEDEFGMLQTPDAPSKTVSFLNAMLHNDDKPNSNSIEALQDCKELCLDHVNGHAKLSDHVNAIISKLTALQNELTDFVDSPLSGVGAQFCKATMERMAEKKHAQIDATKKAQIEQHIKRHCMAEFKNFEMGNLAFGESIYPTAAGLSKLLAPERREQSQVLICQELCNAMAPDMFFPIPKAQHGAQN